MLEQARREIQGRVSATATEWSQFYLPRLLDELNDASEQVRYEWLRRNNGFGDEAWNAGIRQFEASAASVNGYQMMPAISRQTLETLKAYSADLIVEVADQMRRKITRQIQVGVLTGQPGAATQAKIAEVLPSPKGFGTVGVRAEAITRTEFGRIYNSGHDERFQQFATVREELGMPPPRKKWIHNPGIRQRPNHARLGGTLSDNEGWFTIPGSGERCRYPHDPNLSASESVNCRCTTVTVFPEGV